MADQSIQELLVLVKNLRNIVKGNPDAQDKLIAELARELPKLDLNAIEATLRHAGVMTQSKEFIDLTDVESMIDSKAVEAQSTSWISPDEIKDGIEFSARELEALKGSGAPQWIVEKAENNTLTNT